MSDDVTGKDEVITAHAIALAATHWDTYRPPKQLLEAANVGPLALYVVIKYLQSLPADDDLRVNEHAMKAILLGRFPYFVKEALASDFPLRILCCSAIKRSRCLESEAV